MRERREDSTALAKAADEAAMLQQEVAALRGADAGGEPASPHCGLLATLCALFTPGRVGVRIPTAAWGPPVSVPGALAAV